MMRKIRRAGSAYIVNIAGLVVCVSATLAIVSLHADAPLPIDLEEYLQLAVQHSPQLKAGAVRLNAAEQAIAGLPRWYLPDLYVEAGYGGAVNSKTDRSGPLGRIVSAWTLWDGGRSDAEREVLTREQAVQRAEARARSLGVRKTLAFAYYRAARLQELQTIAQSEVAEYERLARMLGPRRRIGAAGASDVANVRLRADRLRAERSANDRTLLALRRSLLILAGIEDEMRAAEPPVIPLLTRAYEPSPPGSELEDGEELDFGNAVEQHPRYRVQQARLRLIKAQHALTERELYATTLNFELYGGYGPDLDALDPQRPEAGAGIRFRFPLFASRDRESRLGAAGARLEALRLESEQKLIELRIEFAERQAGLQRDRRLLADHDRLLQRARQALRLGYAEFRRGQKAPADMIASIETLYDLQRERLDTLLRLRLAQFEAHSLARARESEILSKQEDDQSDLNHSKHPKEKANETAPD
ncbi:MAG: TolC family protein [bacterium]|nr:TolC family protein [bacterium]